jgi:hypothetical protein
MITNLWLLERADQLAEIKLTSAILTSFIPVAIILKKSNEENQAKFWVKIQT